MPARYQPSPAERAASRPCCKSRAGNAIGTNVAMVATIIISTIKRASSTGGIIDGGASSAAAAAPTASLRTTAAWKWVKREQHLWGRQPAKWYPVASSRWIREISRRRQLFWAGSAIGGDIAPSSWVLTTWKWGFSKSRWVANYLQNLNKIEFWFNLFRSHFNFNN